MTGESTDLNSQGSLVIPNGFIIGDAAGRGDCFFDSVAQGMNELSITGGPFDVEVLRQACFNYAESNQGSIYDNQSHKTWRQAIEEDAVAGKYATKNRQKQTYFHNYLVKIGLTAAESSSAIWGRPEIEGLMLCQIYGIKLHIIEHFHSSGQEVIGHQLVDSSGSRSVDEHSSLYNDAQIIHILNEGPCHFVPILRKTSIPKKSIEKEISTSPSEGMQSQNNLRDGLALYPVRSVAVSPQKVSLLLTQPEHQEEGQEKLESASDVNTHQAVDSRYVKVCSLTDKSTWSAVAAKKEDADFKILRIRNSPTVGAALDFMQQAEFYGTFNQASHWFFIVIEVDDCSEFPSKTIECLAEVLDKQKPVIIQWDLMNSAEHLVFFKQTGQNVFIPLQMNSASLFGTEDQLIDELSKQGSFQLPLLLNALKLGIGGQFNGGALDLLNVSFDVKQEIDTWRLIDYAARDDDNLAVRYLLLVDWDLAHQNGEGRRTLEIAAEYGGPQSISALLNLPITSSAEQHILFYKEEKLLALRNDSGDNPLLIAAEKGRPDTLQFLVFCGVDIQCHRRGNEKVTAIKLAWNKQCYEKLCVLLEEDSLFPDEFDLCDVDKSENTAAFLKQVEDRRSFHQAIENGSQNVVEAYIKSHPRLKLAYDPSNQSAMMTALIAGQYDIYALLQSEGFCAGKNEEPSMLIEGLNSERKCRLKQAKLKYFGKEDDSHITYLLSKSRLGIGQDKKNNFAIIRELYQELDAIPEISTILKVVEQSEIREIIFDFDNDSIVDLDPTLSSGTKGICYNKEDRIYIGAKQDSEVLGILAHELAHLAMQVCYDNECKPYEESDEKTMKEFGEIVSRYQLNKGMNSIIERVFTVYDKSIWPAELIVRVPHLLAHYSGEQVKHILTQQAPELFKFYEQHTQENLKRFVENHAYIKARHLIQRLNKLLEKLDEIEQSKIWLNHECFLNDVELNCQSIQILSSHFPKLTILNLYQLIRKGLTISDIKSGYIFVSAEQLNNQEKLENICEAFCSVTRPTLIIECASGYDKSETDIWTTIINKCENRRIIFIAVTEVAKSLEDNLKKYQAKMIHIKEYTWSDLKTHAQNELLKNPVCFQGSPVQLNELISAESPVTKFLPLADLLQKGTLNIGRSLLTSTGGGYIENYYIPRTLKYQGVIKKNILKKHFCDLLAANEQEFIKYCQDKPKSNVHWLLKDKFGRLVWQKSRGSLRALHEYIDTRNLLPYPPENLDEFLQKTQCQKVVLIADTAGKGKTTVLNYLSKQIKQKFPTYWVVRIDLYDHTDVLKAQTKQKLGTREFLCEKLLKFRDPFEKELFKQCCQESEEATKVIIMFDGFDEISPNYKKTVLDLLQGLNPLKEPWIEQLWVTCRPHLREELEDKLQQLCYTLEPFSEDNQVELLINFWHQHSNFQEESRQISEKYARALIELLAQSISDKEKEFIGIPLQTRMLAEAFAQDFETYCLSQKSGPDLYKQLCLVDLYRKFIKEKMNYFKSKGEIAKQQDNDIILSEISITKNHQKLAFEILLPELKVTALELEKCDMLPPEAISRIGIVKCIDNKPHFIHRTIAEYYVADFLAKQLTKETRFPLEVLHIMLNLLLEEEYEVITLFLDGLLANLEKSNAKKQYGKQIYKIWKVKEKFILFKVKRKNLTREKFQRALLQAAAKDTANIIDFCFRSLKATGNTNTIKKTLLKKGKAKSTWHEATRKGHINTIETLWGWGREVQVNLKNDLFLARGYDGLTAWGRAAENGNKEMLETLWGWGREVQVNLKNVLLLAGGYGGLTAWDRAADKGNKEILETLWGWGREVQVNLKNDLLLAKGLDGLNAWSRAAFHGYKEILETLWGWGREVQVNLKDELFLAKGYYGKTAWDWAAIRGYKEILETLWVWGRELQVNLKNDLLLAKEYGRRSAWDRAAFHGNKEILETLWGFGREVQVNLKNDLLLAKGYDGLTAWNRAAFHGNKEILETLWGWGREVQVNLKNDLLLAKEFYGLTAWNRAAFHGNKEILETLWVWGREVQVDLINDLLLSKGFDGLTAWDRASFLGNKEILEVLWCWGREVQLNLKNDLLLARGYGGLTAWDRATDKGNKEILETLWGWGREVQVNLKNDMLLAKGLDGLTAWNRAAFHGYKEILETLWGWGRELEINLKNDLLPVKRYN